MAAIMKGVVTNIADGKAVVRPLGGGQTQTTPLTLQTVKVVIPVQVVEGVNHPEIKVDVIYPTIQINDKVVFAMFEDGTGAVLGKV